MANNNDCNCIPNPMLVIPSTFGECLTYAQQIGFLQNEIEELQDTVTELQETITELTENS